jgi:hypothetical protein
VQAKTTETNLVVGVLGLLVVEAGSLLVIASLRVQSSGLLAVESIELHSIPKMIKPLKNMSPHQQSMTNEH